MLVKDAEGNPFLFETREQAEYDIVDSMLMRLQEYLDGQRDFDDAIGVEEFIIEVSVRGNGTVQPINPTRGK